jgi:hypothetical protein
VPQKKEEGYEIFYGRNLRKGLQKEGSSPAWIIPEEPGSPYEALVFDYGGDVTADAVSWLWEGRIPRGRLTLLASDDTRAASLVAIDLAARLSRSSPWPDGVDSPAPRVTLKDPGGPMLAARRTPQVMYFAPHHERATRCIPALRQAGAIMPRILALDGVGRLTCGEADETAAVWRPMRLPADVRVLRRAVRSAETVQLLVLDPVEAFIDREGGNRAVQQAADALAALAWDFGLAVVAITRLKQVAGTKRSVPVIENKILADVAGSIWGVVTSSRADRQHLLFPLQCSVGEPGPALMFDLEPGPVGGQVGGRVSGPVTSSVNWQTEPLAMTAADFSDEQNAGIKFALGSAFIRSELANGPRSKDEIEQAAKRFGISSKMLRNLQSDMGIKSKRSGYQGGSIWSLPKAEGSCLPAPESAIESPANGLPSPVVSVPEPELVAPVSDSHGGFPAGDAATDSRSGANGEVRARMEKTAAKSIRAQRESSGTNGVCSGTNGPARARMDADASVEAMAGTE